MVRTALLTLGLMACATVPPTPTRPVGDTRRLVDVRTTVPFPEGIAIRGDRFYVSGPAIFPTAGTPPSQIGVFDVRTGELLKTLVIQGQDLTQEHALSAVTFDAQGRLYVIDTQQGILRLDPETGAQTRYAPPLHPVAAGAFPLPNDMTFDEKGWLYVTDSFQATIWRIAPGGGAPQPWFQSKALATGPLQFGANGIRVHPQKPELWVAQTQSGDLYALPLVDQPKEEDLRVVHRFGPNTGPDGLAFARSGKLYVTLAYANAVAVLTPTDSGFTEERIGGSDPWDAPANIAFTNSGSMLVTNHAIVSRRAENFMVLDVYVNDQGVPVTAPSIP